MTSIMPERFEQEREDLGASPSGDRAFVPTGSSPQAVSPVPASIPSAGQWVVFRNWNVVCRAITKVTPKTLKLGGRDHPRQLSRADRKIIGFVQDEDTANRLRDQIGGVDGQYQKQHRAARDDFDARNTAAAAVRDQKIAQLLAKARGETL